MVRQQEKDRLSVTRFFFLHSVKIQDTHGCRGGQLHTSFHFYSLLNIPVFFLMDHLTKPSLSSPRQSWWQTKVISNRLDILPKQYPLWENHPILGHAPIILYFLQTDDGWHLC